MSRAITHSGEPSMFDKLIAARRLTHAKRAKILRLEARIKGLEAEINHWRDKSIVADRKREVAVAAWKDEVSYWRDQESRLARNLDSAMKRNEHLLGIVKEWRIKAGQAEAEAEAAEKLAAHHAAHARECAVDADAADQERAQVARRLGRLCITASILGVLAGAAAALLAVL